MWLTFALDSGTSDTSMIHIIWTGSGYLVFVFVFGFSLIANLITNFVTGSGAYWDAHEWPLGTSLLLSAVTCWFVGRFLRGREVQVLIDPKKGKEVVLRRFHTLFFIPMTWWGPTLAFFALIAFGSEFVK